MSTQCNRLPSVLSNPSEYGAGYVNIIFIVYSIDFSLQPYVNKDLLIMIEMSKIMTQLFKLRFILRQPEKDFCELIKRNDCIWNPSNVVCFYSSFPNNKYGIHLKAPAFELFMNVCSDFPIGFLSQERRLQDAEVFM